jgi:hypothetical protein
VFSEAYGELNEVTLKYYGKPYTEVVVRAMEENFHSCLERYNQLLREELGIEMYVDLLATPIPDDISGMLKVRAYTTIKVEVSSEDELEQEKLKKNEGWYQRTLRKLSRR